MQVRPPNDTINTVQTVYTNSVSSLPPRPTILEPWTLPCIQYPVEHGLLQMYAFRAKVGTAERFFHNYGLFCSNCKSHLNMISLIMIHNYVLYGVHCKCTVIQSSLYLNSVHCTVYCRCIYTIFYICNSVLSTLYSVLLCRFMVIHNFVVPVQCRFKALHNVL